MEKKEIISNIMATGATRINGLVVKSVKIAPQQNYIRVSLTLDKEVEGYVSNDEGATYEKGKVKTIFLSLYSINSVLKDNDDVAFISAHIMEHPEALMILLAKAEINIIQQQISAGEVYVNPWSADGDEQAFDHDTIINHLIDIKLSDRAMTAVDKIADKMLGL